MASLSLTPPGKYLVVLSTHGVNYSHGFIILPNLEAPSTHLIPRFFEGETQDLGHLQSTRQITPISCVLLLFQSIHSFFSIEGWNVLRDNDMPQVCWGGGHSEWKRESFPIFIKHQSNFIDRKERSCLPDAESSLREIIERISLVTSHWCSSIHPCFLAHVHFEGSGGDCATEKPGTFPLTEQRSFWHLPKCWCVQPPFPHHHNSKSQVHWIKTQMQHSLLF